MIAALHPSKKHSHEQQACALEKGSPIVRDVHKLVDERRHAGHHKNESQHARRQNDMRSDVFSALSRIPLQFDAT